MFACNSAILSTSMRRYSPSSCGVGVRPAATVLVRSVFNAAVAVGTPM